MLRETESSPRHALSRSLDPNFSARHRLDDMVRYAMQVLSNFAASLQDFVLLAQLPEPDLEPAIQVWCCFLLLFFFILSCSFFGMCGMRCCFWLQNCMCYALSAVVASVSQVVLLASLAAVSIRVMIGAFKQRSICVCCSLNALLSLPVLRAV